MVGDVCRLGGQWRAVGGAPVRWIGATWRRPLATDITGEFTPAQRSDRRSPRRLGVPARRGYGVYSGEPTWPRATSRQSTLRCYQGNFNLLNGFQTRFTLNFETKLYLSPNSKDVDEVSLFKIHKRPIGVLLKGFGKICMPTWHFSWRR
jgi:hypothetical protein